MPETSGASYAISVHDFDRSVAWCTKCPGFEVTSQAENDQRKGALPARPGALLELSQFSGALSREHLRPGVESHEGHGIFKPGDTTANLDKTFEYLQREGV